MESTRLPAFSGSGGSGAGPNASAISCRPHLVSGGTSSNAASTHSEAHLQSSRLCHICALRLEAVALRLEAIAIRSEAIAVRLEAITIKLEAIANRLEAIANRLKAIAIG